MADAVFITPNFSGIVREEPVGTLLLATILRNAGISADILQFYHFGDANQFDEFVSSAVQQVLEKRPKIVSFYTRCDSYHISLRIAERIKSRCKDIYIVFAGPQADLVAESTIREIPYIDFICRGEGETTIVPFFSSLISGKPDLTVKGLVYRHDGQIVQTPRPELIADLDTLPAIDYSLLAFNNEGASIKGENLFPVDVGRGCPFACTYCSTKLFWGRKYRLKSADRIIEEIKFVHERFGMEAFIFVHDMFTMNREKVIDICKRLKNIGFPIRWRCSARMDCLDEELIDIMTDAGMYGLFVGIETGSSRMQKLIHKNLKLDDIPKKLRYIANKGVEISASFIYGFPEETEDDFVQTMSLMMEISKISGVNIQQHLCTFFPGTELTSQYIDKLEPSTTFSDITGGIAVQDCADLIMAHPYLFSHFFEYKNELREKVKYFSEFFTCWRMLQPVYGYITKKYYANQLCQMLYDFSAKNQDLLMANAPIETLLRHDQFLELFSNDECYLILKEVARFCVWKKYAEIGSAELFKCDVQDVLDDKPIDQVQPSFTFVKCAKADGNNRELVIRKTK